MATVYVVNAEADNYNVQRVLKRLPINGYYYWQGGRNLAGSESVVGAMTEAMAQSEVILIFVSPALLASPWFQDEIAQALASKSMLIVVQVGSLDGQGAELLPARLWALPKIDLTVEGEGGEDPFGLLTGLLPPVDGEPETMAPESAEIIEWDEEIFTASLARATDRHDSARAEALVAAIAGHLLRRGGAYPSRHACTDLQKLRQAREFMLMRRYAEAVLASGARQDKVRRLYAQGLIETKDYHHALQVLQSIIDEADSSRPEIFEAYGLVGRTYKQRYVEMQPHQTGAAEMFQRAITAYETVYIWDPRQFWHGVNAASCMLRAERDGIAAASADRAKEIALQIVKDINGLSQVGALEVWDCASRVEALLALGQYDAAEQALDQYINHPAMTAFEVSSTFRQFDQVLQLGRSQPGEKILARLQGAVQRYRTGKLAAPPVITHDLAAETLCGAVRTRPLVIRLSDPGCSLAGVTDLVVQTRLGKIVTASGSETSVRELLADPMVISVEESRPAGGNECARSIPFIKIAAQYADAAGTYQEKGDCVLIAIVDNGIDVLHKAFLDANGKSRIVGIWDQNDSSGTPPAGFSYGTFHDAAAIAGYVEAGAVPPRLGRNEVGHGTHVASIAGGRSAGDFAGGVAPDAKLLVVVSGGGGLIGYSRSHIEALAFIDGFATQLKLPVVVNVSQGMNAGAHDGKSSLEVAFDMFSEGGRKQGRVVVKSAGNERDKGGHAKVTLPPMALEQLRWKRDKGADSSERIELWWNSADEFRFRLRDPFMNLSNWVETVAPECKGVFTNGGPYQLLFTKRHIDNGDSLLLIELGDETAGAAKGEWGMEIESVAVPEGGVIHCWIERTQGSPSSFLNHGDEEMTISIPGTASSVIAVGAVDARIPIQVGSFSSYGPTRDGQKKPTVCAPGVNVSAALGGTEVGVRFDSGTSMAAPHVTGAIALLLSRAAKSGKIPGGNQIASALRQKTQNYNGHWDRGQGYGVIDATALLAAFE